MRSSHPLALASAVALFACCSCSKPQPPTLVPLSATVSQISPEGLNLALAINATNPNTIDLSSQKVTAHVVVDQSIDLGETTYAQGVNLPAGKTTLVNVPVSVKWVNLAALVQLGAVNRPVPYSVDGTVSLGGTLLNVTLPFHFEGQIAHDQMVNAAVHSLPAIPGIKF
jgi:LEA14-like dessication related protein